MKRILLTMLSICFFSSVNAQSTKAFKWVPWKSVSASTKAELKKIIEYGDKTAYDEIVEKIESECTAEVAILDMDGDGKMEYAIGYNGSYCCGGTAGCEISIYKDGGKKQIHYGEHDRKKAKPTRNGVITSVGVLIKFTTVKS